MNVNFKYCLWFLIKESCILEKLTNDFKPHISIKTKLNKNSALELFTRIKNHNNYFITLHPKLIESEENGFRALYYIVNYSEKNKKEKPVWWPKNAHLSLKYNYFKEFTEQDYDSIKLNKLEFETDKIIIMKCDGHHKEWKKII